jgi:hypothetical protein
MQTQMKPAGRLLRRVTWWVRERVAAAGTMMRYVTAPSR